MRSRIKKLLGISSDAIVPETPETAEVERFLQPWNCAAELSQLLHRRNGFWAYESSLLVRPFSKEEPPLGLLQWNESDLWKGSYADDLSEVLFFAEDAFGCQHCCVDDRICVFDPETSQFETFGGTLEDWAQAIMEDYDYRTGYSLAHEWQIQNQPLSPGMRLLPKVPFVLGGRYEIGNLYVGKDVEGMLFRASIANQIRDVPDGKQVVLEIINRDKQESSE